MSSRLFLHLPTNIKKTLNPKEVFYMKKNLKILISSAMIALSFSMPQNILGMDQKEQVDHHTVKTIIEGHLKNNPSLLNSSKGKDIVVFLGNTGAGKSTLINYLSGKELEVNRFNHIILKNPDDLSAMAIGVGYGSKTFLPGFIQTGNLLFYDLPGFKDTRGTATSLVNACFIKRIIENAKSTTLVFVVGMGQVNSDRADSFRVLLSQAAQLLPDQHVENSSSLIITQSDQESDDLSAYLTEVVDVKQIPALDFWVKNKKIAQMSKPREKRIDQNERENILHLIQGANYHKIQSINIGATYNHRDQSNIKGIYDKEMSDVADQLINNFCSGGFVNLDIPTLEKKKLYLQHLFQDISSALSEAPLMQLLHPISADIYEISLHNMERSLFPRLISIDGEIDSVMREQEKKEEARKRQEEESKRAELEKEVKQLYGKVRDAERQAADIDVLYNQARGKLNRSEEEKAKIEQKYKQQKNKLFQAENEKKVVEQDYQEEVNKRLQAEKEAAIAKARLGDIEQRQQAEESKGLQAEKEKKDLYERIITADRRVVETEAQYREAEATWKIQTQQATQEIDNLKNQVVSIGQAKDQEIQNIKEGLLAVNARYHAEIEGLQQELENTRDQSQKLLLAADAENNRKDQLLRQERQTLQTLQKERDNTILAMKERGALVHRLAYQIPIDIENLKQSKQKLTTITNSKARDLRPTAKSVITGYQWVGCKKSRRQDPIYGTQQPTQAEIAQWEQRQQNFDNQLQQLTSDVEATTKAVLKEIDEYAQYTSSQHPLWEEFSKQIKEEELAKKREIFKIRELGISKIFTQYKILCSPNLTYGALGNVVKIATSHEKARETEAIKGNSALHTSILYVWNSINSIWGSLCDESDIGDLVTKSPTHIVDAPLYISRLKDVIQQDLAKSMELYLELYGKAHLNWAEFSKI